MVFVTFFADAPAVKKSTATDPLSPGPTGVDVYLAIVHPAGREKDTIRKDVSPVFVNRNSWETVRPSGILPKSYVTSENERTGEAWDEDIQTEEKTIVSNKKDEIATHPDPTPHRAIFFPPARLNITITHPSVSEL